VVKNGKITLFRPHQLQHRIITELGKDNINLVAVNCGRQVGKSTLGWNWLLKQVMTHPDINGAWISRWHKQSNKVFKQIEKKINGLPYLERIWKIDRSFEFKNGSYMKFFSADNYEAIRGESIKYLVCDEFALFKEEAWHEAIRPVMAAQKGYKSLLLSTPRGRGFWYDLCQTAEKKDNWSFITAPSMESPFIEDQFIEDARATMPKHEFRQEILAQFIDDSGEIFDNVDELCSLTRSNPERIKDFGYIAAAIDVGFKNDYTVCTIFGKGKNDEKIYQLDMFRERDTSMNYKSMSQKLHNFLKKWNFPKCAVEINMHDSVYSFLKELNTPRVHTYRTTSKNKGENISYLTSLFSSGSIYLIDDDDLKDEFFNFGYQYKNGGGVTYGAKGNHHDDIVMSSAIALSLLKGKKSFSGF
jgi:hypothetical protein